MRTSKSDRNSIVTTHDFIADTLKKVIVTIATPNPQWMIDHNQPPHRRKDNYDPGVVVLTFVHVVNT
jgi:hypothetical protein